MLVDDSMTESQGEVLGYLVGSRTSPLTIRRNRNPNNDGGGAEAIHLLFACVLFLGCLVVACSSQAQDISAVGGWTETIDATDLISGAGSDLTDAYESGAGATSASITYAGSWRVDIKRSDSVWDAGFALYAKRTSDGAGGGSISGGLSYANITTTDAALFSGTQDRSSVNIQYQLTGMAVSVAPNTYSTTIILTVVSTD